MKLKRRHCLSSELLILFVCCSSPCTPNSIRIEIYWIYPQKRTISTSFNAYNLIPRSCLKTHCKKVLSCSNWWGWNHFSLASMLSNCPHTNNASSYFRANLSNSTFHLWIPISVWQQLMLAVLLISHLYVSMAWWLTQYTENLHEGLVW